MRQFKFRAWTKNHWLNNGMIYDYERTNYVEACGWDDFPIMQFIGHLDKNNKEIYEGDILRLEDGGDISHHQIIWDNEECRYTDIRLEDGDCLRDYLDSIEFVKDSIIIGNIYENPELI